MLSKHEVVTGKVQNGKIENPFWAGDAYYHQDGSYFELHLSLFNEPWYLSPNRGPGSYTIFKEKVVDDAGLRFRRPIGKAFAASEANTYLKLHVPLWNPRYQPYLSLFPSSSDKAR